MQSYRTQIGSDIGTTEQARLYQLEALQDSMEAHRLDAETAKTRFRTLVWLLVGGTAILGINYWRKR